MSKPRSLGPFYLVILLLTAAIPRLSDAAVLLSFSPLNYDSSLLPTNGSGGSSNIELVQVLISGIVDPSGLTSFQLALKYDPLQIQLFDPNNGYKQLLPLGGDSLCSIFRGQPCRDSLAMLTSTGRSAFASPIVNDSAAGLFTFGYATSGVMPGAVGDGALAILGIKRLDVGSSILAFQTGQDPKTKILLGSGEVSFQSQSLTISAVPIAPTGLMLATGLLALFSRMRLNRTATRRIKS